MDLAARSQDLWTSVINEVSSEFHSAPIAVIVALVSLLLVLWQWSTAVNTEACKDVSQHAHISSPHQSHVSSNAASIDALLERMGAPPELHVEGCMIPPMGLVVNNIDIFPIENELCSGKFLAMHRATHDKELDRSGDYPFGTYFHGKKRVWEVRVQLSFKKPPVQSDTFFGVEIEKYVPMSSSTKRTMEGLVSMLKRVVGNQVYHSPGDDPQHTAGEEVEMPVFVMPLYAFDQYIVTPAGEIPPQLDDPAIPSMGSKRVKRVREFKEELDNLVFEVGTTYTFCFWGISQWLDKINWKVRMPLMGSLDFNMFAGAPPVHVVIYTLEKCSPETEKRHLQSRKRYYMNLAFWSSKCRPAAERILELLGDKMVGSPASPGSRTSRGKHRPGSGGWLACCASR